MLKTLKYSLKFSQGSINRRLKASKLILNKETNFKYLPKNEKN